VSNKGTHALDGGVAAVQHVSSLNNKSAPPKRNAPVRVGSPVAAHCAPASRARPASQDEFAEWLAGPENGWRTDKGENEDRGLVLGRMRFRERQASFGKKLPFAPPGPVSQLTTEP
jgi:hypothetical protein